ncbi:MAG: transaldolase [Isosphaeraceae bacterium]|jgi:transaldolase/glucose-6-phosphate isomerase|nr:MAG: transaldolase [Isosphaeraceae bacterium]
MATTTRPVSTLAALLAQGQSPWLDFISRDFLDEGGLARLIEEDDLRGVTSNPTIFEKAVGQGSAYDAQIRELAAHGADDFAIYDALTLADIRRALDLFLPVYERTGGADGFVSLEVSPLLARNTSETLAEAVRLWKALDRPNAMIKIPGTGEGLPAIEEALFEGVNVNVTLLFGVEAYRQVAETYVKALRRRVEAGRPIDRVASVASFFVSRIDTAVDKELEARAATDSAHRDELLGLRGKIAIANAKNAHRVFEDVFSKARFGDLADRGARVQRLLWASVGTKNPNYPDTLYVDELIGPETVSTMPPETLAAFKDHGRVRPSLLSGREEAARQIERLGALGIDFAGITDALLEAGVESFAKSFHSLMGTIRSKREALGRSV